MRDKLTSLSGEGGALSRMRRTDAICVSFLTRIVELLQQAGTQLIQGLDLLLLKNQTQKHSSPSLCLPGLVGQPMANGAALWSLS